MVRWLYLRDICDVAQGAALSRLRSTEGTSFPVIQIANLDSLGFKRDLEVERLPIYHTPTVQKDDVLLSLRGSPIRAAVVPETMTGHVASSNIAVLRLRKLDVDSDVGLVNPDFLAGLLGSEYMSQHLLSHSSSGSGTLASLSIRSLRRLQIPIPEKSIQDDFAAAFKYRRELRASAEKLLDLHAAGLESELHLHLGDNHD